MSHDIFAAATHGAMLLRDVAAAIRHAAGVHALPFIDAPPNVAMSMLPVRHTLRRDDAPMMRRYAR